MVVERPGRTVLAAAVEGVDERSLAVAFGVVPDVSDGAGDALPAAGVPAFVGPHTRFAAAAARDPRLAGSALPDLQGTARGSVPDAARA